jgi:hypothetical protein
MRIAIAMAKIEPDPPRRKRTSNPPQLPPDFKPDPKQKPVKRPAHPKKPKTKAGENTPSYPHGHHNCYFIIGCRCDPCTASATQYSKEMRNKRYQMPREEVDHGTPNGYKNQGCRCDPCRQAMRAYQRHFTESPEARAKRQERKKAKRLLAKQG